MEGECSFQGAAESTEGLACWMERKPCLLDKMAGGGHRGQRQGRGRAGGNRLQVVPKRRAPLRGFFQTRKLARSDLGRKASQADLGRMD